MCSDVNKALAISNALRAGTVWVNCFGVSQVCHFGLSSAKFEVLCIF
jgi:hypothetical protein